MMFEPCDHHIQAEELAQTTPEQWEAQGMKPVSREALKRAMEWLNGLCLIALDDGTVLIEGQVDRGDFELVFDDDGPEVLSVAASAGGERAATFDYRGV